MWRINTLVLTRRIFRCHLPPFPIPFPPISRPDIQLTNITKKQEMQYDMYY